MSDATSGNTDRWASEPAIRKYLGVGRTTMRRWRAAGMPCAGDGRMRRYHVGQSLAWLDTRQWKATS